MTLTCLRSISLCPVAVAGVLERLLGGDEAEQLGGVGGLDAVRRDAIGGGIERDRRPESRRARHR